MKKIISKIEGGEDIEEITTEPDHSSINPINLPLSNNAKENVVSQLKLGVSSHMVVCILCVEVLYLLHLYFIINIYNYKKKYKIKNIY